MGSPRHQLRARGSPRGLRRLRRRLPGRWAIPVAALLLAACEAAVEEAEPESEPVAVEVHRVEAETLRDVASFGGQLNAVQSVMIKSETDGVVEEILFREGQEVEEGETLFRLRSKEQAARLREAEARVELARQIFNRSKKLVTRDAASIANHDEAAAELEVARSREELARVSLERTEIRAPFAGVVGLRLVSVGDRITDEDPLVSLDAVDTLELVFGMSDRGIVVARPGLPVEVRVMPYPGETFPGEVFFVAPTVDPATRRLTLKARVPNESRRLRAGLFANADLEVARRENALLVPEAAVLFDQRGSYVWRVDGDDVAVRVPVETGLRKGGRVEITLGLRPGDRVVSAGTHKVREGDALLASEPSPAARGQALRTTSPPEGGEGT